MQHYILHTGISNMPDIAFKSIVKLYCYLAGGPHQLLVFPHVPLSSQSKISYYILLENKTDELIIPNAQEISIMLNLEDVCVYVSVTFIFATRRHNMYARQTRGMF